MNSLEHYRGNRASWHELAYLEFLDSNDDVEDANAKQRFSILIELQYDRGEADKDLVRHLFEQEIISRENEAEGGTSDALWLGAYLLAAYRDPTDIPLFYRAKRADFDAWCGFDIEFMYWAKRSETHEYIACHFPEICEDTKDVNHDSSFYDGLEKWWEHQTSRYATSLADESPLTLYDRNLYLGNIELARKYLQIWVEQQPESEDVSTTLRYAYERLGDDQKVVHILTEKLAKTEHGWDMVSALGDLVRFYSRLKQQREGLECLEQIDSEVLAFDSWKNCGLGRQMVKNAFDHAISSDDDDIASRAFVLGHSWAGKMNSLPYVAFVAAEKAAARCGIVDQAREYGRLAASELKRIEAILP